MNTAHQQGNSVVSTTLLVGHTHQEYHSVCTHSPPPPPRCRAGPRPKDQVLSLKTLHLGVGWLDPWVSLAGWVLAIHDHIHAPCRHKTHLS